MPLSFFSYLLKREKKRKNIRWQSVIYLFFAKQSSPKFVLCLVLHTRLLVTSPYIDCVLQNLKNTFYIQNKSNKFTNFYLSILQLNFSLLLPVYSVITPHSSLLTFLYFSWLLLWIAHCSKENKSDEYFYIKKGKRKQ